MVSIDTDNLIGFIEIPSVSSDGILMTQKMESHGIYFLTLADEAFQMYYIVDRYIK